MPKHGWKWRTEQVGKLSREELGYALGQRHVSARLARWVFENRARGDQALEVASLFKIAVDDGAPWRLDYLWRVLETSKHDRIGDYALAGLTRPNNLTADSIRRFSEVFYDPSASGALRKGAIGAISLAVFCARHHAEYAWVLKVTSEESIQAVCAAALVDDDPHVRVKGISLAKSLGGFEGELDRLARDETVLPETTDTVGFFVRPADKDQIILRCTVPTDLPFLFAHQLDPIANRMAAFTSPDPTNREAFDAHWARIMANDAVTNHTILVDAKVAGYLAAFERFDLPEVGYWIGKEFWGRNIATGALRRFLSILPHRPIYARVAHDNHASRRVLEKCGFVYERTEEAFAAARNAVIEEFVFVLNSDAPSESQTR
ncbi:MAG: GNAT family N-acetyltransferase [Fimbriimonas sp.]